MRDFRAIVFGITKTEMEARVGICTLTLTDVREQTDRAGSVKDRSLETTQEDNANMVTWTGLVPLNMVKCGLDIFGRLRQQSLLERVEQEMFVPEDQEFWYRLDKLDIRYTDDYRKLDFRKKVKPVNKC